MSLANEELLPHVTSTVERFLVNPDGYADGMILLNGVEVYFPPYLSDDVLAAIHVGDRITVYGELPMAEGTPDYPPRDAVGRGAQSQTSTLSSARLDAHANDWCGLLKSINLLLPAITLSVEGNDG